jgi:hypothetical protein
MTILNSEVQDYFDEESSKMFNKQISSIRESVVNSNTDKHPFDKLVKFCRDCDVGQLKELRKNWKEKGELDLETIDRVINIMFYTLDLRKKPSAERYQELIKKGFTEKLKQDFLLALVFALGIYETVGTKKSNATYVFRKLNSEGTTIIQSFSQIIEKEGTQGFEKLKELKLLNYSFEQFVSRQEFSNYFPNETYEKALKKLEAESY